MPRRAWILWMMLALLPLRGWAAVGMMLPAVGGHAPLEAAATAQAETSPCHEQADAADAPSGEHNCLLCHLCHGAVAGMPAAPVQPHVLPLGAPRVERDHDTGRRPNGGLERPPRT